MERYPKGQIVYRGISQYPGDCLLIGIFLSLESHDCNYWVLFRSIFNFNEGLYILILMVCCALLSLVI